MRAAFAHLGSAKAFSTVWSFLSVWFPCYVWELHSGNILLWPENIVSVLSIATHVPQVVKKTRTPSCINRVPHLKVGESVSFGRNQTFHHNQTIATKSKWCGIFLSVFNFFFVSLVVVVRIIIAGFNMGYLVVTRKGSRFFWPLAVWYLDSRQYEVVIQVTI